MATSQDERVSSEGLFSCTPPSQNSLMECDMVEPLVCVSSEVAENLSNQYENLFGDVVIHGQKSNKEAMQLSDVIEVGSEEMELGDELPDHGCLQEDEIPRVGMRFAQLQMANDFYVSYAKKVGFATKIRTTTYDKITKILVNQAIHCNRDGFCGSRVKSPIRKNTISAAGCKARIYVKFDKDMQDWVLFKVELRHSHPCSARKAVHYHEYRQLTMHSKCVIEDNDEARIRPNKTFLALANEAGVPSNLGFLEKDLRNYITVRLRTSNMNTDVREMMSYFMRMKDINPNFFYAVKLDEERKFRSAVWMDARCRASYEYYGDVVSVDNTYSTNKYVVVKLVFCPLFGKTLCDRVCHYSCPVGFSSRHGLPFVSFIGVNHHGKSTLLGCALLGNEKIPSYEWVFSQWVKCMGTAPQRIITNQCQSIFHAIKNTLPDTRHRWCIWHITKKLPQKLGGYHRYRDLYDDLNDIVWNSRTEESFEDNWSDFIDEYNLHNNTWLSDLYDDRRMWVPIYFKGEFWTTMRSTQRTESMHAFYGGFLHSKTSLVQFVHEYDNVLRVKEQRELEDDAVDLRGVIPCATSSPIEKQFQQDYTTSMFRDVQTDFVKKANCRVSVVAEDGPSVCMKVEEKILVNNTILCVPYDVHFDCSTQEVRCDYNLFESSVSPPPRYVLPRWSKKIKRKHTYVKIIHDVSRLDESHVAFRELCAYFYNISQEFVSDDDETALLHAALEETRAKLAAHSAKKRSESVSETHNSNGSQSSNVVGVVDIQGPSKVTTKGRPKSKRLGAALEKSFKNSARRENKNSSLVVRPDASQDVNLGAVVGRNVPEQASGFMSLLSSFNKS
ncbi:protein FAR1-RELATED SEQUENCE 6-like [Arachis hypogaea]|uniref:protein FAR1-RELATED SEQUENCE 6-like n=1 Tax=Arachis hypogaea TaxID=3818 RepID=UPI0007AFD741|nr:protein FAR1-RELATED SEQUENCE 6-like [Arachis hypogaea]